MKNALFFIILSFTSSIFAQFTDNFSDGDFTSNPTWIGETDKFIVTPEQQLRLNAPAIQEDSYLSVQSGAINNATWEFFARTNFNPSSTSFTRVYLASNNSNLRNPLNGYFVLIGDTQDKISLFRQTGSTRTEIIQGVSGSVNVNNVLVKIKVTRDDVGNWTLQHDVGLTGSFFTEGSTFDDTHIQSNFSGVYCQYIASRSTEFYFDDFVVTGTPLLDTEIPNLTEVTFNSNTQLVLNFNEPVNALSAQSSNFSVNNGIGAPVSATLNPNNGAQIILDFSNQFVDNTNYILTANNISDLAGNIAPTINHPFLYFEFSIPQFGEIRINEIMADESPSMGQPLAEYVELYNTTGKTFQLQGYRICNDNSCGTIQNATLGAYGYLVITTTGGLGLFPDVNSINATSFPGLKNAGDEVSLRNPTETLIIDQMSYTLATYQDDTKTDGGYSLELINPFNPCLGADNWRATNSPVGGTPGAQNSIFDDSPDVTPPFLVSAFKIAPNTLELIFNERIESNQLLNMQIEIESDANLLEILVEGEYANTAVIIFDQDFAVNQVYPFSILNLIDCSGNVANINSSFVLTDNVAVGDIVINEILFNPVTGGADYVEIYNRSNKFVNLKDWKIGNLSGGVPANLVTISSTNLIFAPDTYYVMTVDSNQVKQTYVNNGFGRFIHVSLPTYASADGNVYLLNEASFVVDSLSYLETWHFRLIDDRKGKSLERINPFGATQNQDNWQTASETVGWGTPGIQNSQYLNPQSLGEFSINPTVISPDNDGYEDFAFFSYSLPESGMLGTIKIYDENGRMVREYLNNHYFDQAGELKWDGLDDNGIKCRIGRYIVIFNAISIQTGLSLNFKKAVVIAGKV